MDSGNLVPVLSYILSKMVERNDKIQLCESKRTLFHAQKAPLISLPRYLERLLSFVPCSNSCFIISLIYIDRIIQTHSDFILNSLSVHRMLITSVMLATKFFDDETFNNLYYAKVGGLQIAELNQLEEKFLTLIDFSLTIPSDVFERYRCELVKHAKINCASKGTKIPHDLSTQENTRTLCSKMNGLAMSSSAIPLQRSQALPPTRKSHCPQGGAPSLVRSVCEALIVENVTNKQLQSRLMDRAAILINSEERTHHKLSPGFINTLCTQLVAENGLSPTLITKGGVQASRLQKLEKMEDLLYQSGHDYAARDMLPPTTSKESSMTPITTPTTTPPQMATQQPGGTNNTSLDFTGVKKANGCTPSYPNNDCLHRGLAVTWG